MLLLSCRTAIPVLLLSLLLGPACRAQNSAPDQTSTPDSPEYTPAPLPPPQGTVLFSGPSLAAGPAPSQSHLPEIQNSDRDALVVTAYDLNLHLTPSASRLSADAQLTLRNVGALPLQHIALQLSSTLHWDHISRLTPTGLQTLYFGEHRIATDADHTGEAQEAVLSLPKPLAPGATLSLSLLYSGSLPISAERLLRIGAPAREAAFADWDHIGPDGTYLRGFGNILWYPVAASPVLLGDGARLFQSACEQKLRQSSATIRLRLTVEYVGLPPSDAFFLGQHAVLTLTQPRDQPAPPESPATATADFPVRRLGFRVPSLFIPNQAIVPLPGSLLAEVPRSKSAPASGSASVQPYVEAARLVQPLISTWLGPPPDRRLTLLDHPGQPFEAGSLLVAPLDAPTAAQAAIPLVHALAHLSFPSNLVWLDEGVPEFLSLLWLEQTQGRAAVMDRMAETDRTLALAEAELPASNASSDLGQSLIEAHDDVYFRNKASAVLLMLRFIVGDDVLTGALQAYRDRGPTEDPSEFQRQLQVKSGKNLDWFFNDWVDHDRGLPNLSVVAVSPRELPANGQQQSGWLIAVEVANDGGAAAEVPVTIRSQTLTRTDHLRIPAHAKASVRIVFEGTPEQLIVNDGTVPELISNTHTLALRVH